MRRIVIPLLLALYALAAPLAAWAGEAEQRLVGNAARVLKEVMAAPDQAIPKDLLRQAQAIVIVPDVVKTGLMLGGRLGAGLIAVKTRDGAWSDPGFISLSSSGDGFQASVSSTDVILVFRTGRSVETIAHGRLTLGVDASVAAGPLGHSAQASIDTQQLTAEILSYSRTRGLFTSTPLDGTALAIDDDANQAVYGKDITPQRIFAGGLRGVPDAVADFRSHLKEYTSSR